MLISLNDRFLIYNLIIKLFGVLSVLFFGTTFGYGLIRLFDNKPGLIINDTGIFDNSNMSSIGLIEWKDIKDLETKNYKSTPFLLIYLHDNDCCFEKANLLKRILLRLNNKKYKTPISIISITLDCSFNDLTMIIKESFNKYKMPNR